jgi:hypothetical protein
MILWGMDSNVKVVRRQQERNPFLRTKKRLTNCGNRVKIFTYKYLANMLKSMDAKPQGLILRE